MYPLLQQNLISAAGTTLCAAVFWYCLVRLGMAVREVPGELVCRCGYPREGLGEAPCPECGASWEAARLRQPGAWLRVYGAVMAASVLGTALSLNHLWLRVIYLWRAGPTCLGFVPGVPWRDEVRGAQVALFAAMYLGLGFAAMWMVRRARPRALGPRGEEGREGLVDLG
jgi:hypothetical protein